jgi:hypothetical protein
MNLIRLMCGSALAVLVLGLSATAATPDPSQSICPYGGSAATQPSAQGASAGCPVAVGASTQPTATLSVHVAQGTPGGPAIGADPITLALYSNGQLIEQAKATLAADGTLQVKGLPVSAAMQPVVSIDHAGATFMAVGDPLDAQHYQQKLELTVYETTATAPQWTVAMRHIITQPSKTCVDVTDMLSIHNPSDHAWIGKADAAGKKQTVSLALPPGATGVKVGGDLDDAGATVAGGKLFVHQALLPGDTRYEIQYTIPAVQGAAQLFVTAPTNVQHIMVFVPNDGTVVTVNGLQALDPKVLGDMGARTRAFMATSLTAGQTVSIKFEDLRSVASTPPQDGSEQTAAAADNPAASVADSGAFPVKIVAVGGATAILMGGGSVLLLKAPKRAKQS